jgi:ribonuclease BN (tRNA processing enzyme)
MLRSLTCIGITMWLMAAMLAADAATRHPVVPTADRTQAVESCGAGPVAIQILGSGGPRINAARASSSYVLWVDGRARVLVDAGGGAFLRFGQARASLNDLSLVAISHLHPDHVSDLPALLWLSSQARKEPLPLAGPSGNDLAPDVAAFLSRLFDANTGAFPMLGSTLGGTPGPGGGAGVRLEVSVVDVTRRGASAVLERDGVTVTALAVPHGNMPTLAYRVEARGASVVFSSDQTGGDPGFIAFARGADVLIMHLEIGAGVTGAVPLSLHATPAAVGRVARDAGVGRLIVSHIGQFDLDGAIRELRTVYEGALTIGADLQCTVVPASATVSPD